MKKTIILFGVCLIFILLLSGCGNEKKKAKEENTKSGTVQEKPAQTTDNNQEKKTEGELRNLMDSEHGLSYNTEKGRYYISLDNNKIDKDSSRPSIMYVDYATGKEVYLCNKPECKHKDDTCSAVLSDDILHGAYYLFGNGENLFIATSDADSEGSTCSGGITPGYESMFAAPESVAPKIRKMKLDGTSSEVVKTFESGIVLEGVFLQKDDCLYVVTKKLSDEKFGKDSTYTSAYDRKLVKLNLKTKKTEEVMELAIGEEILGCYKNSIITGKLKFERELKPEEIANDNVYFSELKKAKYTVCSIDISTKKKVEIKTFLGKEDYSIEIADGYMYYCIEGRKGINKISVADKKQSVINKDLSYRIMKVCDDILICNDWTEGEETYSSYAISTEDGSKSKVNKMKNASTPIDIVACTKDSFFVVYDFKEENEYVAWAGVNQSIITKRSFGIISKKDFLAGKAKYKDVDMIGMGD